MPSPAPPGSYADFEFFDPSLSHLFPNPPHLPPSSELFSAQEQNHLFDFLDGFADPALDGSPPPPPQGEYYYASSESSTTPPHAFHPDPSPPPPPQPQSRCSPIAASRTKPLLSTPQKRLNHIMSEQKRRNAIRDGYAQLISLLAPAGCTVAIDMPSRGRPKGSGSRGKGTSKGKSGVLFRAVEYCQWLEEGRDALQKEVSRLEAMACLNHPQRS
ncbi:hypothetical protein D9758_000562 [Tetrapyrgos nigripes]|uniref:BHLH domain-containing protein n=1 Tax=Tetrapyrgos nigripes TaxID=182062 RepID=A0A8H5H2A8_9AGAR|nr:hypothetical protein D9758_000562 [Tetrapyrgos nigripes]